MRVIAGPEKKTRVMGEKERLITAYHEMGHAIVGHYLEHSDPVHKISIISRGQALGYTISMPPEDKFLTTRAELHDTMAMTLGGRAAEEIVFGEITTGASNDLEKVTATAKQMVMRFGMSEKLGPRVFGHDHGQPFLGREFSAEPDYSDEIAREIDDEIRRIVEAAHQRAKDILAEHRDAPRARSPRSSLKRETIEKEEFEALLDGKTEEEVFGAADAAATPPSLPGAPVPAERAGREAPRPLPAPRPGRRRRRGSRARPAREARADLTRGPPGSAARRSSVARDGSAVVRPRADPLGGRGARRPDRHEVADRAEPDPRHVGVDRLVLAGAHAVGLVPDPDVAGRADAPVELAPDGQVLGLRVARVALEVLERAPVLHERRARGPQALRRAQEARPGIGLQLLDHPRHRAERPHPVAHLPRLVDAHPDERRRRSRPPCGRRGDPCALAWADPNRGRRRARDRTPADAPGNPSSSGGDILISCEICLRAAHPHPSDTSALFVRLPAAEARKLDRAAHAVGAAKKDLVAGLVARYVDPDSDDGLHALRRLGAEAPGALPRRVVVEADDPQLVVGHHSFRPADVPDVLTPAQAATLLQVDEDAVLALAEEGRLPGRRIGDEWRFARAAVVAWLSGDAEALRPGPHPPRA